MNIEENIHSAVKESLKTLYNAEINEKQILLQQTRSEFDGQLTIVVFPFLCISKKSPEQTAKEIGEFLKENIPAIITDYNVVKGFLNLVISGRYWIELLNTINSDRYFGFTNPK